jgi:hypothetical protein
MAGEAYAKRYAGGFVDLPSQTTALDSQFANNVERVLLELLGVDPTDKGVQIWDAVLARFKTALIKNENIDPAAAIAKSKLGALSITDADIAAGASISQSKLNLQADTLGRAIASGTRTSSVTTSGTTFATGADLLASTLSFTADGVSNYLILVNAPTWNNSVAGTMFLELNLDGVETGVIASSSSGAASTALTAKGVLITPAAGSHTVNIRLHTTAGTASVQGGSGGGGNYFPILVAIYKL